LLGDLLNEKGLDQRVVLKPSYQIWWNKNSIHDHIWIPIQEAMFGTTSTKDLKKHEQIEAIHENIMHILGKKGVDYIPFPSKCRHCHHVDCLCGRKGT